MANGKTMQAVVNLAGSIDPSLGKAIEQAQKKISGLNVKALAVGAAVGGIAVATGKAVIEAGKYMKDLGASFDDAADAIRIGTGATGDALDGLLDDFDAVTRASRPQWRTPARRSQTTTPASASPARSFRRSPSRPSK